MWPYYGAAMSDNSSLGLGDLLALFGGTNPLGGVARSVAQFQKGVSDFLHAVENFNGTMTQLNEIAARVNRLLDDVEPPIRAAMPQLTRSITLMDTWTQQLSAPIERVAPGLARLADTLSSPVLTALPTDLGEFVEVLGDLARRLQPLGQMAESAGSLFGLRPLAAFRANRPANPPRSVSPDRQASSPTAEGPPPAASTPATRASAKKAPAKRPATERAPAQRAKAKKASATTTATKTPAKKRT